MDPDYELYLMGDYNFQVTNTDTEENEPQYKIFLKSLKQDGNVWVVQADERNGLPDSQCMEDVSDDLFDQDIGRETLNVTVEHVEGVRSNSCSLDVGHLRKKQRKGMVENGMKTPINPDPFLVEQHLDEDPDIALSYKSSTHHNNEQLGRSAEKHIVKNVRTSRKVTKGGDCEASRNVEVIDRDYQFALHSFYHDGEFHQMDVVGTRSMKGNPKPMVDPGRSEGVENGGCICLGSPIGEGNFLFREQVMKILRKPYNKKERQTLARDMKATKPVGRNMDLRHGRELSYLTNKSGKSYLGHYPI